MKKIPNSPSFPLHLTIGELSAKVDFKIEDDIQPPLVLSLNDMMRLGLRPDFAKRTIPTSHGNVPILDFFDVKPDVYNDSSGPPLYTESLASLHEVHDKKSGLSYYWDSSSDSDSDDSSSPDN
jgi:hypothetical protein